MSPTQDFPAPDLFTAGTVGPVGERVFYLQAREGGVLLVHTSFRAVRPVEGGPFGLIGALRRALGPEGTLVMPTMTDGAGVFDPRSTPTHDMGITAETFWRQPGVVRSTHPGGSFAAEGPHAARICAPQPLSPPHGSESPVGAVHALDGQILLLGVEHSENTTLHLAEAIARVPYSVAHPCVVEIDGASNTSVDDVREVLADYFCTGAKDGSWFDRCRDGLFAAVEMWLSTHQEWRYRLACVAFERQEFPRVMTLLTPLAVASRTHDRDVMEMMERSAERMGGSISPALSPDLLNWEITVPARHFETALELICDVAFDATFPPDEFEVERKLALGSAHAIADRLEAALRAELERAKRILQQRAARQKATAKKR